MLLPQPRLGTGAQGAALTQSLPCQEHTGSSCALPAGLASALAVTFAPSMSHPCPSVLSRAWFSTETPLVPVQDWDTKSHPFISGNKERLKTAKKGSEKQR